MRVPQEGAASYLLYCLHYIAYVTTVFSAGHERGQKTGRVQYFVTVSDVGQTRKKRPGCSMSGYRDMHLFFEWPLCLLNNRCCHAFVLFCLCAVHISGLQERARGRAAARGTTSSSQQDSQHSHPSTGSQSRPLHHLHCAPDTGGSTKDGTHCIASGEEPKHLCAHQISAFLLFIVLLIVLPLVSLL